MEIGIGLPTSLAEDPQAAARASLGIPATTDPARVDELASIVLPFRPPRAPA
jgi:hypothetical protein